MFYRPLVVEFLASEGLELFVLTDKAGMPLGFLALSGSAIEALFLEPAQLRRGGGRRLVSHAQELRGGALTVDVNEQNAAASAFYHALGTCAGRHRAPRRPATHDGNNTPRR